MSLKVIGFLGKKGHGKDTCADYIVKKHGYDKLAYAGILKELVSLVFGLSNEQLNGNLKEVVDSRWGVSPRTILQFIGTKMFREGISEIMPNIGNDIWVLCLKNKILGIAEKNKSLGKDTKIVISDVRFQNELDMIKKIGGNIVKINRKDTENTDSHQSEAGIDDVIDFDVVIDNDSTIENLHKKIDSIVFI